VHHLFAQSGVLGMTLKRGDEVRRRLHRWSRAWCVVVV
jgi:hypothetical protein